MSRLAANRWRSGGEAGGGQLGLAVPHQLVQRRAHVARSKSSRWRRRGCARSRAARPRSAARARRSCRAAAARPRCACRARRRRLRHAAARRRRTGSSAKSRGSMPRITDTSLIAPASETAAMRRMPSAICDGTQADPRRKLGDGGERRAAVEHDLAAERALDAEAAQHHVGIGDGRLEAAAAVAAGTGHGAGRARADGEIASRCRARRCCRRRRRSN